MAKIMLIDGNSLTYRAFFALPPEMATASGQVTNAVFGFTSMLINMVRDHKPDGIVATFDRPEPTFRHEIVTDYKAGRTKAPDVLFEQMGLVRQLLEALNIPIVEIAGFEADDVIATLATQGDTAGHEMIVVTGDRDTYQLVKDPNVKVLYNKRGVSDYAFYDEAGILERTGVTPEKYPYYAALRGDPSDNLPGVPGVGEKTAAKLINDYGTIDEIYAHLNELTPKLRSNLEEAKAQVEMNAKATPLIRDVPVEVDLESVRLLAISVDTVKPIFDFLEFSKSLWDRLLEAWDSGESVAPTPEEGTALDITINRCKSAADLEPLAAAGQVAIDITWDGKPVVGSITGMTLAAGNDSYWINGDLLAEKSMLSAISKTLTAKAESCAHDAKVALHAFEKLGIEVNEITIDTRVAAYLVNPMDSEYTLNEVALQYAGVEVTSPDAAPSGQLDFDGPDPAEESGRRATAIVACANALRAALEKAGMWKLYTEIERPLIRVLERMETKGVRVDTEYLRELTTALTHEVNELGTAIRDIAGGDINVNSTQQLRKLLFEDLGLTPQKKTKTGFSTDAQSLEKLRGEHEIIEMLIRYREVEKLRSTYGESLIGEVGPDGRIHATFRQTVARTGRLSSENPNLHNIPVRSEDGKRFRRAFIPSEGTRFLVADYNQIELRIIAHLSDDPGLVSAFNDGTDIHNITAARVFNVDPSEVTSAQRAKSKMVSYGLAYGMEAYGLSQRLNIPVPEAQQILDAYFDGFPNVREYMDKAVLEAKKSGYTETLFGRRRQIPEINSSNFRVRQAAERQAMNAAIQGLAADVFKVALIKIDQELEHAGMKSRLVLQVHDEVILEVPEDEEIGVEKSVVDAMRGAADLKVPLEVNLAWATNWAEAK